MHRSLRAPRGLPRLAGALARAAKTCAACSDPGARAVRTDARARAVRTDAEVRVASPTADAGAVGTDADARAASSASDAGSAPSDVQACAVRRWPHGRRYACVGLLFGCLVRCSARRWYRIRQLRWRCARRLTAHGACVWLRHSALGLLAAQGARVWRSALGCKRGIALASRWRCHALSDPFRSGRGRLGGGRGELPWRTFAQRQVRCGRLRALLRCGARRPRALRAGGAVGCALCGTLLPHARTLLQLLRVRLREFAGPQLACSQQQQQPAVRTRGNSHVRSTSNGRALCPRTPGCCRSPCGHRVVTAEAPAFMRG
jgi:hypothetical protein